PAGCVRAGLAEHPLADLDNQPDLLGERDELAWHHEAADGVLPAEQRLEGGDVTGLQIDDRLIVQPELAIDERAPQIELERAAALHGRIHLGLKEAEQ